MVYAVGARGPRHDVVRYDRSSSLALPIARTECGDEIGCHPGSPSDAPCSSALVRPCSLLASGSPRTAGQAMLTPSQFQLWWSVVFACL